MNIKVYTSKPQTVEAVKLTTDNIESVEKWCGGCIKGIKLPVEDQIIHIWNKTFDRELTANIGDYIYTEDKEEFFVSPEEIFLEMYEHYYTKLN